MLIIEEHLWTPTSRVQIVEHVSMDGNWLCQAGFLASICLWNGLENHHSIRTIYKRVDLFKIYITRLLYVSSRIILN